MGARSKVSSALFVQLWMESHAAGHTVRQFADRVGMSYRSAAARSAFYRKRGVALPKLRSTSMA